MEQHLWTLLFNQAVRKFPAFYETQKCHSRFPKHQIKNRYFEPD
jgi:hypothetical protein